MMKQHVQFLNYVGNSAAAGEAVTGDVGRYRSMIIEFLWSE